MRYTQIRMFLHHGYRRPRTNSFHVFFTASREISGETELDVSVKILGVTLFDMAQHFEWAVNTGV
jgi:hypothetical protein